MLEELRQAVCEANLELVRRGLVIYSWGNVSGIDRQRGIVVIKPSGIDYADLTPASLVAVDLQGQVVAGDLRPSSDTPTHLELYRCYPGIGGVCHTHSAHATMFAQASRPVPCLGTTHADYFYGDVPVTEPLTPAEVADDYEASTGRVIVRRLAGMDPLQMPAVLVAQHGPFTWGPDAAHAAEAAAVLEEVARIALGTLALTPDAAAIPGHLLDKHYLRKHGRDAYYGQR